MKSRIRLDELLVQRGFVTSRSRGADAVRRGTVTVDGRVATKAGQSVAPGARIDIDDPALNYVSRGALKLKHALDEFSFDPSGCGCLDIGASTGGFTQILFEHDAAHVTAVDVGRDQFSSELRGDPRVTVLEGTDARALSRDLVPEEIHGIVADVSFISLTKALPVALDLGAQGCWLIALIKPQFEVGPKQVGKGGVVRDDAVRRAAAESVRNWIDGQPGWNVIDIVASPITGGDGNAEFLLGAVKTI
ncbi:MAG: TlyA family RNA methyltransferase [Hyphomicrobiaceae bacterium]|nr:TlyA family RNA methyltransferase [Hyphomicrobiaceae bacterium]